LPALEEPLLVFCSVAPEDETLCSQLHDHLRPLEQKRVLDIWCTRPTTAGTDWTTKINVQLANASIILLLISSSFFACDDCYSIEMQSALRQCEANGARIIPILLRPLDWKTTPFTHLTVLPDTGKPLTEWRNRDSAFANIVAGIRRVIEDLSLLPASTSQSVDTSPTTDSPEQAHEEASQPLNASVDPLQSPADVPPREPQAQSGIVTWLKLLIVGVTILLVGAAILGGIWLMQQNSASSLPKARQTLNQFCMDLKEGEYSDAYRLLNSYRHAIYSTVDQFKQEWVNLDITDCIVGEFQQVNKDIYTGVITLPRAANKTPARELVTIDDKDDGIWKVSDWRTAS